MKIHALVAAMDSIAPPALAESWDNVGLLLGDAAAPLRRLLLTIDLTPEVIDEAQTLGCDAVVAYHPPLFAPTRRVLAGDLAFAALAAGLAVYSPHTAFDAAPGGTNDALCEVLGLAERKPLRPAAGAGVGALAAMPPGLVGAGRVGVLAKPAYAHELVERLKSRLGLTFVLHAGSLERVVSTVAVCAGAGGSLVDDAARAGAELYLVGELGHHDALRVRRLGLTAVCTLHSNAERLALPGLATRLRERLAGVDVYVSARDRDPFSLA